MRRRRCSHDAAQALWRRPRRPAQDAAPRAPGLSPGRITALAAAGCVLAVLLTMLAPSAMFTLGDAARFSNAARMDTPYQSRTVEGDDLYLVRMLNERAEAESAAYQAEASDGNSSQPIYFGGEGQPAAQPAAGPPLRGTAQQHAGGRRPDGGPGRCRADIDRRLPGQPFWRQRHAGLFDHCLQSRG